MEELHIIFRGRVQGVGFRWTIEEHAKRLGLNGFTRNLTNGTVEVCVQGSKNLLETFLQAVQKDPGSAQINSVSKAYRRPQEALSDFRIIH